MERMPSESWAQWNGDCCDDMKENPYSAMLGVMRQAAEPSGPAGPVHPLLGKVLSADPLKVDVAGTPQEADRFYVSARLLKGWKETLDLECSDISGRFALTASCPCPDGGGHSGSAATMADGTMTARCAATLASEDDQVFYLIDKVVRMT